ncbi:MAG: hypothetical protein VCC04_06240, partial [Myxococcota bacterium]
MISSPPISELARSVRDTGFVAALGPGGTGMADPGTISITGRDALEFVHSQVTNDVLGLEPGEGNASARVTRQGKLVELFSLHRLETADGSPQLLLLLARERVTGLLALFDESI